ncbi:MAG: GrpB family protein [bacterium]
MARKIEVIGYRKEWKLMFAEEKKRLSEIFGKDILDIQHIGSTAVEGLDAKPLIDILIVVDDFKILKNYTLKMIQFGYEDKGEFGIKGRRFYRKGGDEKPTHHIHMYTSADEENIIRYIAFREYLKTFPQKREEYSVIKKEAAKKNRFNIDGYTNFKSNFVKETETLAIEWYMVYKN